MALERLDAVFFGRMFGARRGGGTISNASAGYEFRGRCTIVGGRTILREFHQFGVESELGLNFEREDELGGGYGWVIG